MLTVEILPQETRVKLEERMRRKVFSDKKLVSEKLKISLTQVSNWKNGINNPSLRQLQILGINLDKIWKSIESLSLERGTCKLKLPKEINMKDCMWMIGINEGDGANKNRVIGITNQSIRLIKRFISEIKKFGINEDNLRLTVKVNELNEVNKQEIFRRFKIPQDRIEIRKSPFKTNKPIFQVFTPSRLILRFFKNLKEIIKSKISVNELDRIAQGFFDAEGSVTNGSVKITQKNTNDGSENVKFISLILKSLGISNSITIDKNNIITMRLAGGRRNLDNLKKFREFVGFSNPDRMRKLNILIKNFEKL